MRYFWPCKFLYLISYHLKNFRNRESCSRKITSSVSLKLSRHYSFLLIMRARTTDFQFLNRVKSPNWTNISNTLRTCELTNQLSSSWKLKSFHIKQFYKVFKNDLLITGKNNFFEVSFTNNIHKILSSIINIIYFLFL